MTDSTESESMESPSPSISGEAGEKRSPVTTIQEYSRLVIDCMKRGKKMNTTEVARYILSSVRPKPASLVGFLYGKVTTRP